MLKSELFQVTLDQSSWELLTLSRIVRISSLNVSPVVISQHLKSDRTASKACSQYVPHIYLEDITVLNKSKTLLRLVWFLQVGSRTLFLMSHSQP